MDRLSNTVRPYAWGSTTAIPELLGTAPTGEPQAEMWMGAHPGAPSRLNRPTAPGERSLTDVIAADPERELGPAAVRAFGPRLPFLLKLLAAGAPLSLEVHPDLAQAQQGYADEERRGVAIDAPHRTYKDANHKPELICALTPFEGLCGFRRPAEAADAIAALGVDSLKPYVDLLRARPEDAALREVLTAILTADPDEMGRHGRRGGRGRGTARRRPRPVRPDRPPLPGRPGCHRGDAAEPRPTPAGRGHVPRGGCAARLPRWPRRRDHGQLRQRAALRTDPQAHRRPRTAAHRPLRSERARHPAARGIGRG